MFMTKDNVSGRGGNITYAQRSKETGLHFLESLPHEHALKNLCAPQLISATNIVLIRHRKAK